jgi:hypothetical protein
MPHDWRTGEGMGPQDTTAPMLQPRPRKSYSEKTTAEKWAWHTDVYAFRRVTLEAPDEEVTSPCDTEGKWFNADLVNAATRRLREKRRLAARSRRQSSDMELEGRDLCNRWARENGFPDFEAAERAGQNRVDVVKWIVAKAGKAMPRGPQWRGTADDYGVTAREFNPTAEQMAAGRRDAGIDPP